ncbi:MAG TPA: FAD-binding oxidoreductase [Streptosporangiaceae bacterium]|nr:FAD-binding oxidoreductase [Streptosporangiaceae bacterium]
MLSGGGGGLRELPEQDADLALTALTETFACLAAGGDDAAAYFYGWLFTTNPELRDLFPPAMDTQRDRFFVALTTIVQGMTRSAEMAAYVAQLGVDHRKYLVRPAMYPPVGNALIATLRAFAGPAFTPQAERAWMSAFESVARLMINAAEEASARTPAYWTAQVVAHEKRSHRIAVLTVETSQPLPYQAGQHVTVQTERWPRVWRPYSVACRPREDGLLRFHVKAVPGGWVSTALVDHTRVGDTIVVGPAAGSMSLGLASKRDLICVAGGTGLAPLKAIAEEVAFAEAAARSRRHVLLFCGARREAELYDMKDLWQLAESYPWLRVYPVISADRGYRGMRGDVGQVAARYLPNAECEAYVAGPAAMVRHTITVLTKVGQPIERIHFDDALLAPPPTGASGT